MIPVDSIHVDNLYSQDDATFLLGDGFTEKAAREAICEACRSKELAGRHWRKRYWFTGRAFLAWLRTWFGPEISIPAEPCTEPIAEPLQLRQDGGGSGSIRRPSRREGGE